MANLLSDADVFGSAPSGLLSDADVFGGNTKNEPGGFVASAKQAIGATIKGAGQAAADFVPGVSQENALKRYGQEIIEANPTAVHSFSDIADKPLTALKEATGNALSSMGGVVGARALGTGITAAAPFTGPAAPFVAGAGQAISWLGPVAAAALPSFGGIREQQIHDDPNATNSMAAKAAAAVGAGTVGAIESRFGPEAWGSKMLTEAGRKEVAKLFAAKTLPQAIAKGAVRGAAVEGAEELAQNPVEQLAAFQNPLTAEALKDTAFSGAMGALGGGVLGGGTGAAARYLPTKPQVDNEPPKVAAAQAAADTLYNERDAFERERAAGMRAAQSPNAPLAFEPGLVPGVDVGGPPEPPPPGGGGIDFSPPQLPDTGPLSRAANISLASSAPMDRQAFFPFQSFEAAERVRNGRQDLVTRQHPTIPGRFTLVPSGMETPVARQPKENVPRGTGSFADQSELANFIADERKDQSARRTALAEGKANAIAQADQAVSDSRKTATRSERLAILDGVLSNLAQGQNPKRRFDAALKAAGFRDTAFTEEERAVIGRYSNAAAAFAEPVAAPVEPSSPNEMGDIIPTSKGKGAPGEAGAKADRVRSAIAAGFTQRKGFSLINPATGEKFTLKTPGMIRAAKEALAQANQPAEIQSEAVVMAHESDSEQRSDQDGGRGDMPTVGSLDGGDRPAAGASAPSGEPAASVGDGGQPDAALTEQKPITSSRRPRITPLDDPRVATHAESLQAMAGDVGWAEVGGRLIRDSNGNASARTQWIPHAEWFRAGMIGSPEDARKAVAKAVSGAPMLAKEKRTIQGMLDWLDHVDAHPNEAEALGDMGYDDLTEPDQEARDALGDFDPFSPPVGDVAASMRALGFTEEEIREEIEGSQSEGRGTQSEDSGRGDGFNHGAAGREAQASLSGRNETRPGASEGQGHDGRPGLELERQTDQGLADKAAREQEPQEPTKEQADRERDAVPFSLGTQSQPKPTGTQQGLFTADGRPTVAAKQEESAPAWHTKLPTDGLEIQPGDEKINGPTNVVIRAANDAYSAITQTQFMAGVPFYAYVRAAADGRHGIARLLPDDQKTPSGWKLVNGEGLRIGGMTKEQIVQKLNGWLRREPIIGEKKEAPKEQQANSDNEPQEAAGRPAATDGGSRPVPADLSSEATYRPLIEALIRNKRVAKELGFDIDGAVAKAKAAMGGKKQMPGSFRALAKRAEKKGDTETATILNQIADLNDGRKAKKPEAAPGQSAQQPNQGADHGQGQGQETAEVLTGQGGEQSPPGQATNPEQGTTNEPPKKDEQKAEKNVLPALEEIAKRLGYEIVRSKTGFHASVGGKFVAVPAEDADAKGAVSADHVLAHELGHAAMQKRGINFAGIPQKNITENYIPNWLEFVGASKAFRPGVWNHDNEKIRKHAKKANEVIADTLASVFMGLKPVSILQGMMKQTGTTLVDLGLQSVDDANAEYAQRHQDQNPIKKDEGARNANSDATLARTRSRSEVTFSEPYTGTTGAKLVGYAWMHKKEEFVDHRGEDRVRTVSDWEQAADNLETGRQIVHLFFVQKQDGTEQEVSAETAANLLGISESSVRGNAKRMLEKEIAKAKQQAQEIDDANTVDAVAAKDTPAQAVESMTVFGYSTNAPMVKRLATDGPGWSNIEDDLHREAAQKEKYRFLERDGKFIWSSELVKAGSELNRRGWKTVEMRASEIWPEKNDRDTNQMERLANPEARTDVFPPDSDANSAAPKTPIADFGEKLGGARKDDAAALRDAVSKELSDEEIATQPLSKIWPKESIDEIEDPFIAAVAHAARAEIPAKPRVAYKVAGWVGKVKVLRGLASAMLSRGIGRDFIEKYVGEHQGLRHFAEKVSLLESIDRANWDRIGKVEAYPEAYRYAEDGKTHIPAPHVHVEVDGKVQRYNAGRVEDVVESVRAILGEAKPAAKMEFEIRGREGSYFINKKGDPLYRKLKTFDSVKEASEFRNAHYDDLVSAWESVKESDNVKETDVRSKENRPRSAEDWRKGKDVTPEQFASEFGFRGVEWGNWVSQGSGAKDRQGMLNQAYDALMDLADIIGVPPKALSLNGSLGIGFGSRGSGWASAHFESGNLVINLTKTRGAGALAHEWFHALDNYFQTLRGKPSVAKRENRFITYNPENYYVHKQSGQTLPARAFEKMIAGERHPDYGMIVQRYRDRAQWELKEGVRPEVGEAFADLVKALNDSPMAKRASLIDKGKSGGYWSRIIERGARSFENYVISKMMEKGYHNDYLANVLSVEDFPRSRERYPYLMPDEVKPIAEAFDNLFSVIDAKETENGVALESRATSFEASDAPQTSLIRRVVDAFRSQFKGAAALDIRVVASRNEIPLRYRPSPYAEGAYHDADGVVYLISSNLPSLDRAWQVLMHEAIGHYGLSNLMGEKFAALQATILQKATSSQPLTRNPQPGEADYATVEAVRRLYPEASDAEVAQEVLARMAEMMDPPGWSKMLFAQVRHWLRSVARAMNLTVEPSLQEAKDMVVLAAKHLRDGKNLEREMAGEGQAFASEGAPRLAPNGKPSNLNAHQWKQVRTPEFKAWFGDWEHLAKRNALDASAPVSIDYSAFGDRNADPEGFETRAKDVYKRLGGADNRIDRHHIDFVMSGYRKLLSHSADAKTLDIVAGLKTLMERAVPLYSEPNRNPKPNDQIVAWHTYGARALIDGEPVYVKLVVREKADGKRVLDHFHDASVTSENEVRAPYPASSHPLSMQGTAAGMAPDKDRLRAWYNAVNPDSVSKVVDENGEPLVVYHGTAEDFAEFDPSRAGQEMKSDWGAGVYFTPSPTNADYYRGEAAKKRDTESDRLWNLLEAEEKKTTWSDGAPTYTIEHGRLLKEWRKARAAAEYRAGSVMPVYLSIKTPLVQEYTNMPDPYLADRAKGEGRDGIVVLRFDGSIDELVAFDPKQIKSAIGNRGAFDSANPNILESRSSGQAQWHAPEPSRLDDLIYSMQDKHVDLKRVVQSIKKTAGSIADNIDPYLQEELFHGRAAKAVKDFLDLELRPLIAEMRMRGVEMADFEEYLWNRHAEERNAQIAKINPQMPDGGSGLATADAMAYLAGLSSDKRKAYESLAAKIDAITAKNRQVLVDSGLEKAETIAAWGGAYKHYVPLQREDVETGGNGTGQGFSVRGNSSKRAVGSGRPVADIIANLAMQRERFIVKAEKNRVSIAIAGLAASNPNPDFWKIDDAPKERVVETIGGQDQVVGRTVPSFRTQENVVHFRLNGEDHFVIFNEREPRAMRMAQSIKNLDMDQLGRVLTVAGKVTRYFAAINTQYNPVFGIINLFRDVQGALLNLSTTPLAGEQKRVAGYTVDALRGIYADIRAHRAGKVPSSRWASLYEEFQNEGGQTGYRDQFSNAEQRAEAIAKEIKAMDRSAAFKAAGAVFDWLSDYNQAMENAVRLAAYAAAKERGLSKQQAASLAKNLTVNFNRKGQVATQMGALYAFFNASMQGTARLAQTLTGPMGRRIITGGILLGSMQAMLLASAGLGDDEPPEFVRERNLILPIGDGKYISLPMPLGFHVLPNLGRIPTEFVMSGFREPARRISDLVGIFADAFNPIGNAGLSLQTIAPTVVDPFAALAENKDWTGKPIAKLDMNANSPTPGHIRAKDTATIWSKTISEAINYLSGGTQYKPGVVSPTPDQIDYLIGQVTGGVGREVAKTSQTVASTFTGEELPLHKVPLVGRFVGDAKGQSAEGSNFYAALRRINEHENEIKGMRKDGRGAEVARYIQDNPEAKLMIYGNRVEREVQALRSAKRDALERGDDWRVRMIESALTAKMRAFNERVKASEIR